MRLIDADEFALLLMRMQAVNEEIPLRKDRLTNKEINNYNTGQKETFDLILQNLEKQPTAYNVDKVVKQLESEAKRWEEYKTLEEQGKLFKLPCAAGDMIYNASKLSRRVIDAVVERIEIDADGFWIITNSGTHSFDDFGKTVFLTQKEAEAALKEILVRE